MSKLTGKQQKFIDEYLKCFNATKAAELAGYTAKNGTLRSIGSENLTKPNIKKVIAQHFQASAMSAEEAVSLLAEIARGKVDDGTKVKVSDRNRALELIGKAHGIYTDKVQIDATVQGQLVILPPQDNE